MLVKIALVIFSLAILAESNPEIDVLQRKIKEQDAKIDKLQEQIEFLAQSLSKNKYSYNHADSEELNHFGASTLLTRWGYINVAGNYSNHGDS